MKEGTKKITEWVKSLTKDDYIEMGKELESYHQMDLAFYASPRLQDILNQVKLELETKTTIHDDPYTEPLFGNVTNAEFNQLFSCLFNESISGLSPKKSGQEDDMGNEEILTFEGLRFRLISGQGIGLDVSYPKVS